MLLRSTPGLFTVTVLAGDERKGTAGFCLVTAAKCELVTWFFEEVGHLDDCAAKTTVTALPIRTPAAFAQLYYGGCDPQHTDPLPEEETLSDGVAHVVFELIKAPCARRGPPMSVVACTSLSKPFPSVSLSATSLRP